MSNLYTISTCLISKMKKLTYEKLPSSKVNIIRLKKKKKSFGLTQILCIMSFLLASSHTSAGETKYCNVAFSPTSLRHNIFC